MAVDELTAGEKLDRALAEKPGRDDIAALRQEMNAQNGQILQAIQNLAGRVDELSRQFAASQKR